MAGYKHQAGPKYTPEQTARIRHIQEMTDEALTIRERATAAERRIEERRLAEALEIERRETNRVMTAAMRLANVELERLQRDHPQPAGVGAKRMAQLLREIEAAKVTRRVIQMGPASYDMAA